MELEHRTTRLSGRLAAGGSLLLIVAVGLFLRRDFLFHSVVWNEDMANYWLPLHCYLGKSLAAGHIPAWNPHTLSGIPFAADPQGGWLNFLAMALFTTLPCGVAIRWLVVVQPILAGVALYWFLREEDVSRAGATIGGVVLCGALAGSIAAVSIRFPVALGWTAVLLACSSRYLKADRRSRRVLWLLASALAWGQMAASQFGVGLTIGTGAWLAYIVAKLFGARRQPRQLRAIGMALLPVLPAFAAVNIAWFLPRLAFLPELSLGDGYRALNRLALQLIHVPTPDFPGLSARPPWPIDLSTTPGRYLGGAALLTSFAGLWSRRGRSLAVSFCAFGLISYLASLRVLAEHVPSAIQGLPIVDGWLHGPQWTSLGVLLSIAVLGGLGVDAWRDADSTPSRALMVAPGMVAWAILPLLWGAPAVSLVPLVGGGAVVLSLFRARTRQAAMEAVGCVIVAAELVIGPFLRGGSFAYVPHPPVIANLAQVRNPLDQYLEPNEVMRTLRQSDSGRFMLLGGVQRARAARDDEAITFELESVTGYQSVQLRRYWILVRRLDPRARARYQYAAFRQPSPALLDLLQVNWLISSTDELVELGAVPVAQSGSLTLYRRPLTIPRASLVFDAQAADGPEAALDAVAAPGFDPSARVVVESTPSVAPSGGASAQGVVSYVSDGPQAATLHARSPTPGIVLIRNIWDRHWHATMDGRPAPLLRADYALQAVAVPAGAHTIELSYDDPTIGLGLLGSAVAIALLVSLAILFRKKERR
jgi:hypothetical protein